MSYQVLARKWRPRTFEEMVGQRHVLRALINALDHDRLHHAYLFTGTRGVGKTTIARILAKSLNCETGISAQPCGECDSCAEIDSGRFVDLIEVDAASRTKVEDTRDLLDNVQYAPTRGRYKVYLIDEVHMLSNHSFNALLKTLEEPPPHVKFLLATTDPQRLPVTILSRCLQFNLKRLPIDMISAHLSHILAQEKIASDGRALALIAKAADGSMRDALSLLDQAIAYGGGQLQADEVGAMLGTIERDHVVTLARALASNNPQALLASVAEIAQQAPDFAQVLAELLSLFHRIALVQMACHADGADETDEARENEALARTISAEDLQLYYQIGLLGQRDLPLAPDPRTGLEMVLLRMVAFRPAETIKEGADKSRGGVGQGATTPQAVVAAESSSQARVSAPQAAPIDTPWSAVVAALKADGLVHQLAANCQLQRCQDDQIVLILAPSHASLKSAKLEARLRAALEAYYGKAVKLTISVGEVAATPALEMQRESAARLQAAQQAIEEDRTIKAMKDTFNAQVVPNSVQPVDP